MEITTFRKQQKLTSETNLAMEVTQSNAILSVGNYVMSGMMIAKPAWSVTVMQCSNMAMNISAALHGLSSRL